MDYKKTLFRKTVTLPPIFAVVIFPVISTVFWIVGDYVSWISVDTGGTAVTYTLWELYDKFAVEIGSSVIPLLLLILPLACLVLYASVFFFVKEGGGKVIAVLGAAVLALNIVCLALDAVTVYNMVVLFETTGTLLDGVGYHVFGGVVGILIGIIIAAMGIASERHTG